MIGNIIIAVIAIVGLLIVFCVVYILGAVQAFEECEPDHQTDNQTDQQDLHCFQCEIEMPVKEKNGSLYCKNCGLRHQNF